MRRRPTMVVGVAALALLVGAVGGYVAGRSSADGDREVMAAGDRSAAPAHGPTSTTTTTSGSAEASEPSSSTTTEPERLTEKSTIDVRGAGPIEAGVTVRQAERAAGRRILETEFDTFDRRCWYADIEGIEGLSLLVVSKDDRAVKDPRDGIVGRVTATEPRWQTVSGARVGTSLEALRKLYPGRLKEEPHQYQEGGLYVTFEPKTEQDGAFGIRFEIADGQRVDLIHSGRADTITAPEGCA